MWGGSKSQMFGLTLRYSPPEAHVKRRIKHGGWSPGVADDLIICFQIVQFLQLLNGGRYFL